MLARPAAPLATGMMKISSVDKTHKDRLPLEGSKKTNFRLIICISTNPENISPIDGAIIDLTIDRVDLTGIVENK